MTQERIYLMEDNAGNQIIDNKLTPEMIEKLEVSGVQITIYRPYKKLFDNHFLESQIKDD